MATVIDMLKDRVCETTDVETKAEVSNMFILLKSRNSFGKALKKLFMLFMGRLQGTAMHIMRNSQATHIKKKTSFYYLSHFSQQMSRLSGILEPLRCFSMCGWYTLDKTLLLSVSLPKTEKEKRKEKYCTLHGFSFYFSFSQI